MIELGVSVEDTITKFKGILVARTVRQGTAVRCAIQSPDLEDGKPIAEQWFDETRLQQSNGEEPRIGLNAIINEGGAMNKAE